MAPCIGKLKNVVKSVQKGTQQMRRK